MEVSHSCPVSAIQGPGFCSCYYQGGLTTGSPWVPHQNSCKPLTTTWGPKQPGRLLFFLWCCLHSPLGLCLSASLPLFLSQGLCSCYAFFLGYVSTTSGNSLFSFRLFHLKHPLVREDFPKKLTGFHHFSAKLLYFLCVLSHQSCLTVCNPMVCSPPGPFAHGILQTRILEWVVIPFSRVSSQPRNWTRVSCISRIGRRILYHCTTWEALPYIIFFRSLLYLKLFY